MVNEEDPIPSLDDLFNDAEPAATQHTYTCADCGKSIQSSEPLKFCSSCGASLSKEASSQTHVLLVEDAAVTRRRISTILRALDCRVTEAEDGHEALRLIGVDRPDLVILDVHMPNKSGIEVLKELRQQHTAEELPVVMLTAEADIEIVKQAVVSGADDYIRKDAGTADVRERLSSQIRRLQARSWLLATRHLPLHEHAYRALRNGRRYTPAGPASPRRRLQAGT